jgi:hypothetical protein
MAIAPPRGGEQAAAAAIIGGAGATAQAATRREKAPAGDARGSRLARCAGPEGRDAAGSQPREESASATAASLGLLAVSCPKIVDEGRGGALLRAAACTRKITPVVGENHSDPIYMGGFDNDRTALSVHDDLWARGIVLERGETKIALVTLDVVGYFHNEVETIRSLVDPALGFD